jgi:hypothetical protein
LLEFAASVILTLLFVLCGERLRENICAASFIVPTFALEHFEHRKVFLIERITLDELKVDRLPEPLAAGGSLGI